MTISKDTRSNLDRIGSGQASYQQVVNELRAKYAKKELIMFSKYDVYTTVQSMYCYFPLRFCWKTGIIFSG